MHSKFSACLNIGFGDGCSTVAYFSTTRLPEMQYSYSSGWLFAMFIFIIDLNNTFKQFWSDVISRGTLRALIWAQVISKARGFKASLQTESAITKQQFEKPTHKVTPCVTNTETHHLVNYQSHTSWFQIEGSSPSGKAPRFLPLTVPVFFLLL